MTILLTGCAGFIGFHVAGALLARGEAVVGVDNFTPYYDVALKKARLAELLQYEGFGFHELDIADETAMRGLAKQHPYITHVVHLAAQPGVRYSLENPMAYIRSNLVGHAVMLELARHLSGLRHFVYASSSSVYGGNSKLPFAVEDRVDAPVSLYAATKRSDELMTHTYSHLYGLPATGLRFFTVYGPWGRPDMAPWLFTEAILKGEPIKVYGHGAMRRDFTYITDIVAGVLAALERPPAGEAPHKIYNLGNSRSENLLDFIAEVEKATGQKAIKEFLPIQPGDVAETYADISEAKRDLGFKPQTPITQGVPRFVEWYKAYTRR